VGGKHQQWCILHERQQLVNKVAQLPTLPCLSTYSLYNGLNLAAAMPNHFIMLWSKDYCDFLSRAGAMGKPLQYIWGGYNSGSDFKHYQVKPDDYIYPIAIRSATLYLIARMRVYNCISLDTFQNLFPVQSGAVYNSCADQILIGLEGTPIRLDRPVPTSFLESLTFQSGKGHRKPKSVEGGKVLNISSFQGIYRLTPDSVNNFEVMLE
jgi:hypothetical protein